MSAVKEANDFLAPVFDKEQLISFNETSLILRLSKPLTSSTDKNVATSLVINKALGLLLRIHKEICERDSDPSGMRLERPGEHKTIFALIDLLILEGIYPNLSPHVGIPIERRARSFVIPRHMMSARSETKTSSSSKVEEVTQDPELLGQVVDGLMSVLRPLKSEDAVTNKGTTPKDLKDLKARRGYPGIEGMVRERALVDLIAGCGELAFNPEHAIGGDQATWKEKFSNLIDGIQTGALLPLLLSLLHPAAPPWFRQPITKYLSQLPVSRPHAVRSIIELFLSTASSGNTASQASAQLSVEALSKASRLISSVPANMSPREYFSKVCPQLLEVLRGNDPGMERAAAYIIAELLGKKGPGVHETIEEELVQKIIGNFDPKITTPPAAILAARSKDEGKKSSSALLAFEDAPASKPPRSPLVFEVADESDNTMGETEAEELNKRPLVSDTELSMAFRNLETLMASHPSPVIPERLISPILIPLWGLMCYAQSIGRSSWHDRAAAILKSYLAVNIDSAVLQKLQAGLLFTGSDEWEYAPGSTGGIEIRKKAVPSKSGVTIELVNSRVEKFLEILGDDSIPASVLSEYFLSIFRTWLARGKEEEPLKMLVTVKILQEMLQTHGERLAKKPTEILQIIKEVLDEYVDYLEEQKRPKAKMAASTPSLSSLGKIVQELPESTGGNEEGEGTEEERRTETVAMALTLLSVLISSPDTKLGESDERLVTTLHPALEYLSSAKDIDPNLTSLAVNISSLLLIHAPTSETGGPTQTPLAEQQRETYATALSYLRDPLIPVRAHGLHLLRQLILARAPIIDVAATARLLITMLKDSDSFVYLNVVKCLAALTDRHSKTVTRMLVSAYLNEADVLGLGEKLGLDERLRIGEALLGTVQKLGQALVAETAEVVAQGMLAVISRRRANPNPPPPTKKEEEEMDIDIDIDPETGEKLTPAQMAQREHAAKIVAGWADTPHEDLRIRASALSILGAAVQTNPSGLGPRVLNEVLDTALAILTQETTPESAILRRAAVAAVNAVLNALVKTDEEDREGRTWRQDVWKVLQRRVNDIRRVLGYVRVTDVDGLVREQAGAVEENLVAVLERRMLGGAAEVPQELGGRILEQKGKIEVL